jgi:hypothetical protein
MCIWCFGTLQEVDGLLAEHDLGLLYCCTAILSDLIRYTVIIDDYHHHHSSIFINDTNNFSHRAQTHSNIVWRVKLIPIGPPLFFLWAGTDVLR